MSRIRAHNIGFLNGNYGQFALKLNTKELIWGIMLLDLGYHAIKISLKRNFQNNFNFFLKTNFLNNIEKEKLTIIHNNING